MKGRASRNEGGNVRTRKVEPERKRSETGAASNYPKALATIQGKSLRATNLNLTIEPLDTLTPPPHLDPPTPSPHLPKNRILVVPPGPVQGPLLGRALHAGGEDVVDIDVCDFVTPSVTLS